MWLCKTRECFFLWRVDACRLLWRNLLKGEYVKFMNMNLQSSCEYVFFLPVDRAAARRRLLLWKNFSKVRSRDFLCGQIQQRADF